jgi:outer membrane protein, heavy metal efflux system
MRRQLGRMPWLLLGLAGCQGIVVPPPLPPGANIRQPAIVPELAPPEIPVAKIPLPPGTLELDSVLNSVRETFPLVYAIEQERGIAAGQLTAAESAFDPVLRSRFFNQNGSYPSRNFDVNLEQATPYAGATLLAGYRVGLNEYPSYNGGSLTADGGEFRIGGTLPLLRGNAIDPARARVRAAQINAQIADPVIRRARLDFFLAAAQNYWTWVQAGARYEAAKEILALAETRKEGIDKQFKAEQVNISVPTENERQIRNRRAEVVRAKLALEQSAFTLSLFYRDGDGNPIVPQDTQLPARFLKDGIPAALPETQEQNLATAYTNRPELARFQLLRQRLGVDLKLSLNDFYPRLNLFGFGSQDFGAGKKDLERSNAQVGATFELPLPRRDALGRRGAAESQIIQTLYAEKDARDRITIEVQNAVAFLARTRERITNTQEALEFAIKVQEQDEKRFQDRAIDILTLNIRETLTVEAKFAVIDALADYYRALAILQAALGVEAASK